MGEIGNVRPLIQRLLSDIAPPFRMFRQLVPKKITPWFKALLAAAFLAPLTGCWLDGPQSTFHLDGPVAKDQLHLFMVTVYVTAFIFVVVGSVLAYATLKFRVRTAEDEHAEPPPQTHGNSLIELGLVTASVLCLVIIAVPTLRAIYYSYNVPAAQRADEFHVKAIASQWWFKFEYQDEKLKGGGPLVTANELVVPANRPIYVELRSMDVVHSFWVPKLAGKVDMIPNRPNHIWFEADRPGYYYGQCAEFCGDSHARMRFRVIALPPAEFAAWLANQMKPARTVTAAMVEAARRHPPQAMPVSMPATVNHDVEAGLSGSVAFDRDPFAAWQRQQIPDTADENAALIAKGRHLFDTKTCIACHTIRGQEGVGITGPDLTHVGARTTIAGGSLQNTPALMHDWITRPNYYKPGNKMWNGGFIDPATGQRLIVLNSSEITAIVAYLQSLK